MDVKVVVADITKQKCDAIVNAANKWCLGGSGVDGAIHKAAGPGLLQECKKLTADASGVRCPTGEARITGAGNLPCRFVIHTVGPDCSEVADKSEQDRLLASAYAASLRLSKENGVKTIAFPSISTGIFGFPIQRAAKIVAKTVGDFLANEPDMSVTMCILDRNPATEKELVDAYARAFAERDGSAQRSVDPVPGSVAYEMTEEDYEFLEQVSLDLAFIVQRINRQLSEGREPKPGKVALKGYESIDSYILLSLAKADKSGQAARLWSIYEEVGRSGANGWRTMVLERYWNPGLYNIKNPSASTGMGEWGFDRMKFSCGRGDQVCQEFPTDLTEEMVFAFKERLAGSTNPHKGMIGGRNYVLKLGSYSRTSNDDHVHNEYVADCFLRAAGCCVPMSREYKLKRENGVIETARLSVFIENARLLGRAADVKDDGIRQQIIDTYPLQSFIAGIDTYQHDVMDNVLVNDEGRLWFVDNGASFDYRATGGKKGWYFKRRDVLSPSEGFFSLLKHESQENLRSILRGVSEEDLRTAAAQYNFSELVKTLPQEYQVENLIAYAANLDAWAKDQESKGSQHGS